MFDANDKESLRKPKSLALKFQSIVKVGGALTGEHGVGIEKRELCVRLSMIKIFNNRLKLNYL